MIKEALENVNEAKIKFWDILKDEKKIKKSGRILSKPPKLDISFYDGYASINFGKNSKGTIYNYEGITFATRFNSVKDFEVIYFDSGDNYYHSEYIKVNALFKKMGLKKLPYELLDTAITTITGVTEEKGSLWVNFKNGSRYELFPSYNKGSELRDKRLFIDSGIFKLEKLGFKVNKIKQALKILVPEIYNKRKINKFTSLESLDEYLEMEMSFGFQDTGGITGEGIGFYKTIKKDKINLYTSKGHAFHREWRKFDIDLVVPITKINVDKKIKIYKGYRDEMAGRLSSYGKGLADWVKSTGGHKGNPVWMD